MKKLAVLFIILLGAINNYAQEKVNISLNSAPLSKLLDAIQQQTGYRIFYQTKDIDALHVTISCIDETPLAALRKALQNTALKFSFFNNMLFILPEKQLITTLPESYSLRQVDTKDTINVVYDLQKYSLSDGEKEQRLVSESRIYNVGSSLVRNTARAKLTGKIISYRNGEPMTGISLSFKDMPASIATDATGAYSVHLPIGRQEMYLKGINVKDTKVQLMVYSDGVLNIELEEETVLLNEATASVERIANVRSTTMGLERIKMQNIKNIPSAFGEVDIIKTVMLLPGVKSAGEASSGFNVRGGATDQNLILYNDGTIYNPSHLFGIFSAFNPDIVKDMELYKSSIPAKFGGRISSVLDITSKEGNKQEYHASASIGLLTSRLTVEGPIIKGKTSFIAGGRTSYSDWILKLLDEKSGYKDGSANFYDLNATINHKFNNRNNLTLNGYYSHDKFHFTEDQKYEYANANASMKWRHIFSDQLIGMLTAGYDHYGYETRGLLNTPSSMYALSFNINQGFGKLDFIYKLGNHTLDFGLSSIYYKTEPGSYLPLGDASLVKEDRVQNEKALESALYAAFIWNITDQLSINTGVRYSMFSAMGPHTYNIYDSSSLPSPETITEIVSKNGIFKTYHSPEVRVSTRYAFTDDFSIKAGFNTMSQNIHKLSNSTLMTPTDTWKLSDANIKPQTGMQAALGLYKNFAKNTIEGSIEGYYKAMSNYLDYRSGAELLMNHHIETDVLPSEGRAYGVELMIKKMQGDLTGWVSYSYSKTELRQSNPIIDEPVNKGRWYPSDVDKPHDFKFVGNYKITKRFSFSLNCEYSTGRPITLPVSKYQYAGGEYTYYSDRNKYRIPDFFRLDASFNIEPSHHITILTHSTISFGVYNVTGRKNAYSVYYAIENGTQLKGYKLSIFGAPIPYLSYNIQF